MTDSFPVWVEPKNTLPASLSIKRRRDVCLPFRTVEDDNRVLRPAREGETPCINGDQCTACRDITGGPGVPLVAMAPADRCILCLRLEMRAAYISHTVLGVPVYEQDVVQLWESPEGAGGYHADFCMKPGSGMWNGFVSPCVFGRCSQYRWILSDNGWHIDQDALLHFRQAPAPPVHAGASSGSSECIPSTAKTSNAVPRAPASWTSPPTPTPPSHPGPHPQPW